MNQLAYYFFRSKYRFPILGLVFALASLWYLWLRTDQIISSALNLYTTGIVLLNTTLAFFSFDRHTFITRFLFIASYILVGLAFYTLLSLSRGLH